MSLDDALGPGFFVRLALRRAEAGHFSTTAAGVHVGEHGREVNPDVAGALGRLLDDGCLTHGAADAYGRRPIELTAAGVIRLSELSGGGRG